MVAMMIPSLKDVMNKNIPLVGADQNLRKAAEVMLANRTLGVVTADVKRRPMLVLTYRTLVKHLAAGASVDEEISKYAIDEPIVIHMDQPITEALKLMKREAIRFLPVVDSKNKIVGTFEPHNAANLLWEILDYGDAEVRPRLRKLVTLPSDATIRIAAKAMNENNVPEILVRVNDEYRILREEDFLRAVAEGRVDDGTIGDYAKGRVINVPETFDAKAAVDLMLANGVRRLIAVVDNVKTVITMSDLAFEAGEIIEKKLPKETAFVLVKTESGRELDIATRLILEDGVREVYTVTGDYDILAIIDAPSLREIYNIVREKIRRMPGVYDTNTLIGVRIARKKET